MQKKVRRIPLKSIREGMQLLLYSGVASTHFVLYSGFRLKRHFFPKIGLQVPQPIFDK